MHFEKNKRVIFGAAGALIFWFWILAGQPAAAQGTSSQAAGRPGTTKDDYQRSSDIYNYQFSAKSGPQRGEEIYYFKCWMCHNKYAQTATAPVPRPYTAPSLKDLYRRPKLLSGQPVNDETVKEKIRSGGPAMPSYRHTLTETHLEDLISYIRDGKCCFEGELPPPNPRYRAR